MILLTISVNFEVGKLFSGALTLVSLFWLFRKGPGPISNGLPVLN